MKKVRSYISMLMLALLLFPIVEKASHDFKHLNDDHCAVKGTHYCPTEHTCSICDYVFSSSDTPTKTQGQLIAFATAADNLASVIVFNTITSPKFTFSLRGPPVC
jgi:hypothetical protein